MFHVKHSMWLLMLMEYIKLVDSIIMFHVKPR